MTAGYSGTSLTKKLGLKDGMAGLLLASPPRLREIPAFAGWSLLELQFPAPLERKYDYIHVFEKDRAALQGIAPTLRECLRPDGILWISWPKKASKVATTITEDTLREIFLPTGLVDVKVAAIDDVWSGLKVMFRKEIRSTL